MTDIGDAYLFATGEDPPEPLRQSECEGTIARRRVVCDRNGAIRWFRLCTRHADILWNLGFLRQDASPAGQVRTGDGGYV